MFHRHLQNRMCIKSSPHYYLLILLLMFQIKFSVEGEEIVIPLGLQKMKRSLMFYQKPRSMFL